jgi:hypothetical protein
MSTNLKLVKPVTGYGSLERPRYSPGLMLRDDDLNLGVDYTSELSRLLFSSFFGCGVICGLKVEPQPVACGRVPIIVNCGIALDSCGNPVQVPKNQTLYFDPTCGNQHPTELWVVLRRIEKQCAPRSAACSCDDDEVSSVCTRERDGFEIQLLPGKPETGCMCLGKNDEAATAAPAADATNGDQAAPTVIGERGIKSSAATVTEETCMCSSFDDPCYADHYAGVCNCDCADCDCDWIVLAKLKDEGGDGQWKADHSVRRFIRPVLMRDPVVLEEKPAKK